MPALRAAGIEPVEPIQIGGNRHVDHTALWRLRAVLSTSAADKVSWYENTDGLGNFGPEIVISTEADGPLSLYAADLDGDGDIDVLVASTSNGKIVWYENIDGLGSFGPQHVLNSFAFIALSVYAADLDGDGDADVLSASQGDNTVAWYENKLGGNFGPPIAISTTAGGTQSVFAADLDGDGDNDVLAVATTANSILWFENEDGLGSFGSANVITTQANLATTVHAEDLDGDGDADVLSASFNDNKIAWYENLSVPPSAWVMLGNGFAGTTGVPTLIGTGTLLAGTAVSLDLANAQPFAFSWLVLGLSTLNAPFKGGTLVPMPDFLFPFTVDGFGTGSLSTLWPQGAPSGATFYSQWWIQDSAGPAGFAASNGVSGTTP